MIANGFDLNFSVFYSNHILVINTILMSLCSFIELNVSQSARILAASIFLFVALGSSFGEWAKFMWLYQIYLRRLFSLFSSGLRDSNALGLRMVHDSSMGTITLICLGCIVSRQITHPRLIVENASSWHLPNIFPRSIFIQLPETERVTFIQKNVFHCCLLLFVRVILIVVLLIFSLVNSLKFGLDSL